MVDKFLVEASAALSSSLEYQTTLNLVTKLSVPYIADWCSVYLVNESGIPKPVAITHKDKNIQNFIVEMRQQYPLVYKDTHPAVDVIRNQKPKIFIEKDVDRLLKYIAKDKKHLGMLKTLNIRSYVAVPLIVRGQSIGAMTFASSNPRRIYTDSHLELIEELARRAAIAVENARLYSAAQEEIEERKKAEESLKKSEEELKEAKEQLEIILQGVDDGITVQDPNGQLVYANSAAAKLIGFDNAYDLIQSSTDDVISRFELLDDIGNPLPLTNLPGGKALSGEVVPETTIHYRLKLNNEERWSIVKASPVFGNKKKVLFAINVFQDITERKRIEKQKDEFLAITSHELKTPVTTIKGFIQVLKKRFDDKGDSETSEFLHKVENQIQKLTSLVAGLLDISRIDTGKMEFNKTNFEINSLIKETVEDLSYISDKHQIVFESKIKQTIYADRDRIAQILTNLVLNAITYSPKSTKIVVILDKNKKGYITVKVKDLGIGISKENIGKLFERYFRGNSPKSKTYPGLGLGLFICSEIIKRHNGKIGVSSKVGVGSSFYFSLPIKEVKK